MTSRRFVFFSFLFLVVGVSWLMAQSPQQTHEGSGGHADIKGIDVPFVPGPKGTDGKVHQVEAPKNVISRPLGMTKEGIEEKKLADGGKAVPTTKPVAKVLSPAESSVNSSSPNSSSANSGNAVPKGPNAPNQPSSANFPGVGFTGFIPPDGGVASGPVNVVAVVNSTINVYDKNGNLLSSQSLFNLFSATGTPASDGPFDPSVAYDAYVGRFIVFATSENDAASRSSYLIAVSNGSDVAAGWSVFALDATINGGSGTNNWCDYPHFGFDAQAIYLSCNMFNFPSTTGSFQYAKVRIMTMSQFTVGGCCSWWDFWNLREGFLGFFTSFTVHPAIMHFAGTADGDFWVNAGSGELFSYLRVRHLTNAQNCCFPTQTGPNLDEREEGVGGFSSPPGAQQPGTSTTIDTGDARLLYAIWEYGHLSTGQNLACDPGGGTRACIAFTEIDVSGYPSMSNVNDWFLGVSGEDLYYPYVDENSNADKTMVYTRSDASSTFAGAYYRGIPNPGICTLCVNGEVLMRAGAGTYINFDPLGRNRWGDYHGAGADPDGLGIWVEGELATAFNAWDTEIVSTYNSYFPSPVVSNNPLAFGNQTVFTTSGSMNEFVTNNGNATLDVGLVFISGDSNFFIVFDGCSFHAIQPGNSCVESIEFGPTSVGPGNATLNVPYNTFFSITPSITGTGTQAFTSTTLASLTNPSVFGQPVTFRATVTSTTPGTPTGTVTFWLLRPFPFPPFALGTGTVSGGVATLTTSGLSVGAHSIFASYNGDANFHTSNSSVITQTVNKDATSTLVTSSKNPSVVGTAVTFTAKVAAAPPGSGTPSGTVTFKNGASILGTVTLSGGKATLTTSALTVGNHLITAVYGGDGNFNGSSGSLTQAVRETSSTSVVSSVNPSVFGQVVTFTASVTPNTATGTVTFKAGATVLGTSSVISGKATLNTATLAVGADSITATYNGSTTFLASTSPVLSQTVNKATSKTTVASSVNPSVFGQSVTFKATVAAVAPGSGTPTGSVTFKDGATTLGTRTLSGGVATLSISTLTVGAHSLTVTYNGSIDYNTSTSTVLTQTVHKAATSTTLTSSPNPSTVGQTVTFKVKVAAVAPGSGTPIGSVTLKDGATALGTAPLISGTASFATSLLAHGTHSMTAVYSGSANDLGSTSAVLTQTVN